MPREAYDRQRLGVSAAEFTETIERRHGHHVFIRAGRPQTNGCVERVQRTILQECWRPAFARYLNPKITGLRLDLDRYLHYHNEDRAHTGRLTKGRNCGRSHRKGEDVEQAEVMRRYILGSLRLDLWLRLDAPRRRLSLSL